MRKKRPLSSAVDRPGEVAEGEIPEETAGPYPGDGSNGPNVLSESGVVRSDITSSFGSASGVAEGIPTTVKLKVYDLTGDEQALLAVDVGPLHAALGHGRVDVADEGVLGLVVVVVGVERLEAESVGRAVHGSPRPGAAEPG